METVEGNWEKEWEERGVKEVLTRLEAGEGGWERRDGEQRRPA